MCVFPSSETKYHHDFLMWYGIVGKAITGLVEFQAS